MTTSETTWDAGDALLATRLSGSVELADVQQWQQGLEAAQLQIPDNTAFSLLVDLSGYEHVDLATHKAMRGIIPLLLASHGFRTALIDVVGAPELPLTITRGIVCVAVAHVHHDPFKMEDYQRRFGRPNEHFFTSPVAASEWITELVKG